MGILAETDKQSARVCIVRKVVVHARGKLLGLQRVRWPLPQHGERGHGWASAVLQRRPPPAPFCEQRRLPGLSGELGWRAYRAPASGARGPRAAGHPAVARALPAARDRRLGRPGHESQVQEPDWPCPGFPSVSRKSSLSIGGAVGAGKVH